MGAQGPRQHMPPKPGTPKLPGRRNYFSTCAIQVVVTVEVGSAVYNPGRSLRRLR